MEITPETLDVFKELLVALAAGFLIGLERGWHLKDLPEGTRIAGVRTFSLIGLLGGVIGYLSIFTGPWIILIGGAGMFLFALGLYLYGLEGTRDKGATTEVAMVVTFILGVLAILGEITVVVFLLILVLVFLSLKQTLHTFLEKLDKHEINAVLQMVVLSGLILPFVPNQGFGPGGILNPFEIWLMVLFIQGISFFGHFAIRFWGARAGTLLMGFFGGLASTTALTLTTASLSKKKGADQDMLAASLAASIVIMFGRVLMLVGIIFFPLLDLVKLPLVLAAFGALAAGFVFHRRAGRTLKEKSGERAAFLPPPSNLLTAFGFAALLTGILVLTYYAQIYLASGGVISLAALSGFIDIDPISISLAKLAKGAEILTLQHPAVLGLFAALVTSAMAKIAIAWWIGTPEFGKRAGLLFVVALGCSAIGFVPFL